MSTPRKHTLRSRFRADPATTLVFVRRFLTDHVRNPVNLLPLAVDVRRHLPRDHHRSLALPDQRSSSKCWLSKCALAGVGGRLPRVWMTSRSIELLGVGYPVTAGLVQQHVRSAPVGWLSVRLTVASGAVP